MRHLRLIIISIAAICILALGVFAFVAAPATPGGGDDVIIIKGGSLEITCAPNQGNDCLGSHDAKGTYKHKSGGKIVRVEVKDSAGTVLRTFTKKADFPDGKPIIEITYRNPKPEDN